MRVVSTSNTVTVGELSIDMYKNLADTIAHDRLHPDRYHPLGQVNDQSAFHGCVLFKDVSAATESKYSTYTVKADVNLAVIASANGRHKHMPLCVAGVSNGAKGIEKPNDTAITIIKSGAATVSNTGDEPIHEMDFVLMTEPVFEDGRYIAKCRGDSTNYRDESSRIHYATKPMSSVRVLDAVLAAIRHPHGPSPWEELMEFSATNNADTCALMQVWRASNGDDLTLDNVLSDHGEFNLRSITEHSSVVNKRAFSGNNGNNREMRLAFAIQLYHEQLRNRTLGRALTKAAPGMPFDVDVGIMCN